MLLPLSAVRHKGQAQEFTAAYTLLLRNLIDAFEQIVRHHDIYSRHKSLSLHRLRRREGYFA